MHRTPIITADGSPTISIPSLGVTYHSMHGSIQESMHVFIEAGLRPAMRTWPSGEIGILEMGFGTGLNALLTMIESALAMRPVHYTALELFPLEEALALPLKYPEGLGQPGFRPEYEALHKCEWERKVAITPNFTLLKRNASLLDVSLEKEFHLVYFDAFAPTAQPELWTEAIFARLRASMHEGGFLNTYCAKGSVRRAMTNAGFAVEKLPGPTGKREMTRANWSIS